MKNEILEEIENMAPYLVKVGNENPFKVPNLYFENMALEVDKTLIRTAENVPTNYFEHLSDDILAKVKTEKPTRIISISAKRWAAAASVILLCVASYFTMNTNETISESESFALDVELEEAFDYLADHDDLYISEVLALSQVEVFEETEEEFNDMEIDFLLDEVALDDLDELL